MTVTGGGKRIGGSSDGFYFVYQALPGDGEIVGRLDSLSSTNDTAEAGLMIRGTLDPGSPHMFSGYDATAQISFHRRVQPDGSTVTGDVATVELPVWLKVVRSGTMLSSYASFDGSDWSKLNSRNIEVSGTVYAGLAIASGDVGITSSAGFDQVAILHNGGEPTPTATPSATPSPSPTPTPEATPTPTFEPTPTPEPTPPATGVIINEILTRPADGQQEFVELYNASASPVDISGWLLTNDLETPHRYTVPQGTIVPAGAYLVLTDADYGTAGQRSEPFTLNSSTGVYLLETDEEGTPTGAYHGFEFPAAQEGVSFARYVTSITEELFPPAGAVTMGAENSLPKVGPVIIARIMVNPPEEGEEFIELKNISSQAVSLYLDEDPSSTWRIAGVDFTFPEGHQIPAGESLIVTRNGPDQADRGYFPDADLITGPYPGELRKVADGIALLCPVPDQGGAIPYAVIDSVMYNSWRQWVTQRGGQSNVLIRLDEAAYGNDPANWEFAPAEVDTSGITGWLFY